MLMTQHPYDSHTCHQLTHHASLAPEQLMPKDLVSETYPHAHWRRPVLVTVAEAPGDEGRVKKEIELKLMRSRFCLMGSCFFFFFYRHCVFTKACCCVTYQNSSGQDKRVISFSKETSFARLINLFFGSNRPPTKGFTYAKVSTRKKIDYPSSVIFSVFLENH